MSSPRARAGRTAASALIVAAAITLSLLTAAAPAGAAVTTCRAAENANYFGGFYRANALPFAISGVSARIQIKNPDLCQTDTDDSTNFSSSWVMIYDSTQGPGKAALAQAGFIRTRNNCVYDFGEVHKPGGEFSRVIADEYGCLSEDFAYDYAAWSNPSGYTGTYVNGREMNRIYTRSWVRPLKDQYNAETTYPTSDVAGRRNDVANFDPIVVRDPSGVWFYTPCGMARGGPNPSRYHVGTDGSCRRFWTWTDPVTS